MVAWEIMILNMADEIVHHSKGNILGNLDFAMNIAECICNMKNVPFTKHNVFLFPIE